MFKAMYHQLPPILSFLDLINCELEYQRFRMICEVRGSQSGDVALVFMGLPSPARPGHACCPSLAYPP